MLGSYVNHSDVVLYVILIGFLFLRPELACCYPVVRLLLLHSYYSFSTYFLQLNHRLTEESI